MAGASETQAVTAAPDRTSARARSNVRSLAPPSSSVTLALPPVGPSATAAAAVPGFASEGDGGSGTLAPEHRAPFWPWLLAAIALGAGGAFLFWRKNSQQAFAGGPRLDSFVAPQPQRAPTPRAAPPAPVPARPAAPAPTGIVSTRLRPWIDISVKPLRCIVEEQQVTFEFDVGLYNSGSAPAREVLIEATMINASPTQDQEIGAFFDRPVGEGARIAAIEPHGRVEVRPKVVVPKDRLRVLDAGGRKVFVPLIAFNALYRSTRDERQTSAAYLIGRNTGRDKLAPFRLDLGPRVFRGLDTRPLEAAVRS